MVVVRGKVGCRGALKFGVQGYFCFHFWFVSLKDEKGSLKKSPHTCSRKTRAVL